MQQMLLLELPSCNIPSLWPFNSGERWEISIRVLWGDADEMATWIWGRKRECQAAALLSFDQE